MAMTNEVPETGYVFDQDWEAEKERLGALQTALDPHSVSVLDGLGIAPGWRCLDVGGGGGSITRWLCRRVAPSGSVTAIDLDTRLLDTLDESNLTVRRVDLFGDDFPADEFDLVHARYVLEHLPERNAALLRLVRAAKPGGLVVVSDSGGRLCELTGAAEELYVRSMKAFREAVASRGWNLDYAPTIPERMREAGLLDVGGATYRTWQTGSADGWTHVCWHGLERLREPLVATGKMSHADIDAVRAMFHDPARGHLSPETTTAWGRRPG
jgi:SAM-dependent methyltransferase